MQFTIFTLFPEMFPSMLGFSLAGTALEKGLWQLETVDIKQFGLGKHRQVDDTPYGGGAGMLLKADVIGAAIDSAKPKKLIYMSARGKPLAQARAQELAQESHVGILCGRFEGVDQRVIEHYNIEEICIGDYVLSGGEPAALVLMDAVVRLLPEVMGNPETLSEESFARDGLLEYPQFTRPAEWQGRKVPNVLMGGNHAEIAKWRHEQAIEVTKKVRGK